MGDILETKRGEYRHPLLEVEIVYKNLRTKLLISRCDVYIVGYHFRNQWYALKGAGFRLKGSVVLENSFTRYQKAITKKLGVGSLKKALEDINKEEEDERKVGLESFFVHLSESVRFYPVQSQVLKGMMSLEDKKFLDIPNEREQRLFAWVTSPTDPHHVDDIMKLVSTGAPGFSGDVKSFNFLFDLVRSWGKLSSAWYSYCVDPEGFDDELFSQIFEQCKIQNLHALKSVLGLLCSSCDMTSTLEGERKSSLKKETQSLKIQPSISKKKKGK